MSKERKEPNKSIEMSRRTFIKSTGAVAATAALGGVGLIAGEADVAEGAPIDLTNAKTYTAQCAMECLHHSLKAYVVDGKIVKVEQNTDGSDETKCCLRGISRTQWVNHKDRLTSPMLRTGPKGSGEFKKISWDEAVQIFAEKINETKAELGNQGIICVGGSGNFGMLTGSAWTAFFRYLGGTTEIYSQLCCQSVTIAGGQIIGSRSKNIRDTVPQCKYMMCWGTNVALTNQSYYKLILEAQANGGKTVTIDPRFSETAAKSDEYYPILPGTDTALALGILKVIIEENLYDAEFLKAHTSVPFLVDRTTGDQVLEDSEDPLSYLVYDGEKIVRHDATTNPVLSVAGTDLASKYVTVFDLIYEQAKKWTPEAVEEETRTPAHAVTRIAHDLAAAETAMIYQNMGGFQRAEYGVLATAAQYYLLLYTGNFGRPGTGVYSDGGAAGYLNFGTPFSSPNPQGDFGRIVAPEFGKAILEDRPNKIGFLLIHTTSILTQYPNTNACRKALEKIPFVVKVDNLMTSDCYYADLILPCATVFEEENFTLSIRNNTIQISEKAVEPPGEAKSDLDIVKMLANHFGFGDAFKETPEQLIDRILEPLGLTYQSLKDSGPINPLEKMYPLTPYKDGIFDTPTGKAMLFVPDWKDLGYNPVLTYYRPIESVNGSPELASKYPLAAVQRKTNHSIHSSFSNLPWIIEACGNKGKVLIHPDDAAARGIKDGDPCVVYNDRGEHRADAIVRAHIMRGVVAVENGWWDNQGGSSSHITSDTVEQLGGGQCCNNSLVEVRKEA